jgi:TonB family protein
MPANNKLLRNTLIGLLLFTQPLITWAAPTPQVQSITDPAHATAEKLYQEKRYQEAANAFKALSKKQKENADIWMRLGLSYFYTQKIKDAVKAFETVIKLRPNDEAAYINSGFAHLLLNQHQQAEQKVETALKLNAKSYAAFELMTRIKLRQENPTAALQAIEQAIQINPAKADAYLLKAQTYVRLYTDRYRVIAAQPNDSPDKIRGVLPKARKELFGQAAESLAIYLSRQPDPGNLEMWQQQLEALRAYAGQFNSSTVLGQMLEIKGESLRPTITYKEKASYTEAARSNAVEGTVTIMVIFAADGTLRHPIVLRSLHPDLDQNALRAAAKIRFIPAMKDGKTVSVIGNLEYSFNLY